MTPVRRYSLVSLAALGMAMPAFAQEQVDAPAATPADQTGATAAAGAPRERETIIVTANKREESVQDIAVAITAVSSEDRQELGIATITDLTNVTPGLSYTAGNERVTLRGVGRNTNNFGAEPGVANYTDGVYQSFASIAGRDDIFVDRIEVLRGPQGTLYGRNSLGGAINIISKRPTDEFEAEVRLAAGNFEYQKIAASVSGPITDWLRYRAVGYKEQREGVYDNFGTNTEEGYEVNNYNWEIQLEGDIGDRLSWWTKYTTGGYHMAGPPGGRTSIGSNAPYLRAFTGPTGAFNNAFQDGGILPLGSYAFSGDTAVLGSTQDGSYQQNPWSQGIQALNSSAEGFANLDAYNDFGAEIIYEAPGFDVKYVGGYIYYNYRLTGDNDGYPTRSITYNAINSFLRAGPCAGLATTQDLNNFPVTTLPAAARACITSQSPITIFPNWSSDYNENRAFFSNELNFISTWDSPFQWIAGLYAYQENFKQPVETFLRDEPAAAFRQIPGSTTLLPNPGNRLTYTMNEGVNNSYGVYAQGDYTFLEDFKATLGLRYSYDVKSMSEQAQINCYIICYGVRVPGLGANGIGRNSNRLIDMTPLLWNGVPGVNPSQPQPGVTSATLANPTGVTYNPITGLASRSLGDEWDAVTGTAGLEWSPSPDLLLFGKYSRGYKTGGFNATDMAPLPRTKPETVDAFELGWKQEWRNIFLTTNAAAFFYKYNDVQTPLTVVTNPGQAGSTTFTSFINLPEVETTGFELETTWNPIEAFNLRFTYAYLQPEITDGGAAYRDPIRVATDPGRDRRVEGNLLPQSPENKVAVNASYLFTFEDGSTLLPSVSWYWRDSFYSSIFNNPQQLTPDYQQTDARLLWNDADGRWTVIGFVRNAFDEEGYDAVTASLRQATGEVFQSTTFTPPRMYGVELQFHFR
jgi:iron complex outermembrane recepter protein